MRRIGAPACLLAAWAAGALAAGALLVDAPAGGAEEAAGPPVVSIESPTFDWGTAFRGQQLFHDFVVRNTGGRPLRIEALKPNCGCMIPPEPQAFAAPVPPGGSLHIRLRVDTSALAPGTIRDKHTEIVSNAEEGDRQLHVEGVLEELFAMDPPHPRVEVIRGHTDGGPARAQILLEASGGRAVKLGELRSQHGILRAASAEIEPGRRYRIDLEARPESKDAFQRDILETTVRLEAEEIPFAIPVTVLLRERIDVQPSPSVFFPRKATAALAETPPGRVERDLKIVSIGGDKHSFRITKALAVDGHFAAQVAPTEEGKAYTLKVSIEKPPPEGQRALKDTIEVHTDDPEVPVLSVRVSAQF